MPLPFLIPFAAKALISGVASGVVRDQFQQNREAKNEQPAEPKTKSPETPAGF